MLKKIFQSVVLLINLVILVTLSIVIIRFSWDYFAKDYVYGSKPVGGDYFNALTYQDFFSKFKPNLINGWLPFWNEGAPVIGGYPALQFYLTNYLTKSYDTATAMNLFSAGSFLLFLVFSLLLFAQVAKNWFVGIAAIIGLIITRATYYQLTTGGFISSASTQWYLPAVLFFIYKFAERFRIRYLILASFFSGLSLLQQAPTSLLMIFIPSFIVLAVLAKINRPFSSTLVYLVIFTILSFGIGSIGLYTVFLQNFFGSGTSICASTQCWGIYPKHLIVWLNWIPTIIAGSFLLLAVLAKFIKRKVELLYILPSILGLLFFITYGVLAYYKLINGMANVIFPTRIFWVGTFFILLVACSAYYSVQKALIFLAYPISIICLVLVGFYGFKHPPNIHKDYTATVPLNASDYVTSRYKTKDLAELVPDWMSKADSNYRLDTMNSGLFHWWNIVSEVPSVRGYSNHPLGTHKDWLYFLQKSTRNIPDGLDPVEVKNRIHFLLDAYGVGYIENSVENYPESYLKDQNNVTNYKQLRDFLWFQLSTKKFTPIVDPTNTKPLLFVGDDKGYQSFLRILASNDLSSKVLIPVKGPEKIGDLNKQELRSFPILVLYGYKDKDFGKLENYIKDGGKVFIETGSLNYQLNGKTSPIFPIDSISQQLVLNDSSWAIKDKDGLEGIDSSKFAPLAFKGRPWKLSTSQESELRSWAKAELLVDKKVVIAKGKLGQGEIIWSGLNLPFHIIDKNNFEESRLFASLLKSLLDDKNQVESEYQLKRPKPNLVEVTGKNFRGVYFKENYHPGWQAFAESKKLKVYRAGLDFMYIPTSDPNLRIEFKGPTINLVLVYLTGLSALLTLVMLIYPRVIYLIAVYLSKILGGRSKKIASKINTWWKRDEEE